METDLRPEGSTELRELMTKFVPICIREYVAEIRRRDWKKCCPFKLSGDPQADKVLAALVLEDNNINPRENIIDDDAADDTINEGPSVEATRRVKDARLQNETSISKDAIVAVNDRLQDSVIADNAAETVNTPSESAACRNQKSFANAAIAADGPNIAMNDGPSESSDFKLRDDRAPGKDKRRRNLARRKPQKFRRLSDIYNDLGSCIYKREDNAGSEFNVETSKADSADVTLGKIIREKRSVRRNSERIEMMKKKRKASENNRGSDSEHGSKYFLRTKRMHEHQSKEFSSEDSISPRGRKRNRESVEEGYSREVLKLLDGNQRRLTKEDNHSRPSHGAERAQHPVETTSGRVQKRIRETSPETDDESMAVMQLLRLSQSAKHKSPSGPDVVVPPALGSMVSKPPVEEVVIIDGNAGLANAAQTKSVTYRCRISRNPAEFPTPNAKKFMRRGKLVKTV